VVVGGGLMVGVVVAGGALMVGVVVAGGGLVGGGLVDGGTVGAGAAGGGGSVGTEVAGGGFIAIGFDDEIELMTRLRVPLTCTVNHVFAKCCPAACEAEWSFKKKYKGRSSMVT
jgi:hypothetical protein